VKKTPAQYLRLEAKRHAANALTLDQEESMEQWFSLARWAEQWPAHLPHDLSPLADVVIRRRWASHNDPDTMLRELSYVDMNAALRGACYCVLLVLAEYPVWDDQADHSYTTSLVRQSLANLSGDGAAPLFKSSPCMTGSGALSCLDAIVNYRCGEPISIDTARIRLRESMRRASIFGLSDILHNGSGSWREYDAAYSARNRRMCREIREHVPCPPASEWVRAEMETKR
jgi:hypothetical protein